MLLVNGSRAFHCLNVSFNKPGSRLKNDKSIDIANVLNSTSCETRLDQSRLRSLTTRNSINAIKNTTMKMPVYTPALNIVPIASHPVRRNANNTRIIV